MCKTVNLFLYFSAFIVNLLIMLVGIAMSWSSPSLPKLKSNDTSINPLGKPLTTLEESWMASLPAIGCVFGTLFCGFVADKLGRKLSLIIFSFPFLGAYLAIALIKNLIVYLVCRFLLGISSGCTLAVLPSYVGELAEDTNRGFLLTMMGILGSSGYTFVFAVGPFVSIELFAYLQIIPIGIFYIVFVPFIPESPYYYIERNKMEKAEKALKRIRITDDVGKELAEMTAAVNEIKNKKSDWRELYSTKVARKGLTITCGLLAFQQFMGFSAVLGYMQTIFEASKTSVPTNTASIIIGVVQIISNFVSTLTVDKLGRRPLLLISNIGCSISLLALGIFFLLADMDINMGPLFWLPITSLVLFFSSYNFGFGTLPLTICGEVFNTNIKSLASSLSLCVCLSLAFIVTWCFPYLSMAIGNVGCFFLFGGISLIGLVFVIAVVPETKNKSFKEIQEMLEN